MLILHYLVPMPTSSSAGVTSSTSSRSSTGLYLYMSTYAVNCLAIYYVNSSLLSAYAYKFLAGVTSSTSSKSSTGLYLYMSTYAVNCLAIYYVNSSLLSAYAYKFLCGGYIFNIFEVFNRSVPMSTYAVNWLAIIC